MKTQSRYYIYCLMLLLLLVSCKKEEENFTETPTLFEIKIVNAGANAYMVVEGTIKDNLISFPPLTNSTSLNGIKFDAKMSSGAQLDSASYTFANNITRKISVINGTAQTEYIICLTRDTTSYPNGYDPKETIPSDTIPDPDDNNPGDDTVLGADFANSTVFDFLGYPDFTGNLTRSTDFDGEHVLIVTRNGGSRPHLLKLSDLETGNSSNPIMLSTKDVAGGTYPINAGRLAQGHIYICNLTVGSATSPLKLYHWASPSADPELIFSFNGEGTDATRYGDNMSLDLDENGDGYAYFSDNAGGQILRAKISNFTTVSDPIVFATPSSTTYQTSCNKVDGANEYIFTGKATPIYLTNARGDVLYEMTNTEIPQTASNARIINFIDERYLVFTTFESPTLYVYNITQGATTKDALIYFDNNPKPPVFSFDLNGTNIVAPGCDVGWGILGDELYIYGAQGSAGFVIAKFPKTE